MTKIFQFLQKKLGMSASDSTFSMQTSIQNTFIGMENVHVLVDERGHPSWAELFDEFGDLQEHEIRGDWKFVQYYSKSW